jgi:iron complex transport system ATP-binding protein
MMALQTHDLAIGYRTARRPDVVVAEALNLALRGGELVCLLGPNGSGKSTLLRTVAGMQQPLAGRVQLAGDDIARLNPRELARRLSIVLTTRPQVGLLNGYALVALGRHPYTDWTGRLSRYDEAVVRWAVEAVGAVDIAERPVLELSDGQQQKLMIARALAQESELILLDEPTAFLDLPRRAEVMRLLRGLAAQTGRAILLSTHDLDLALRSADTLWLMSGGQVRVGTPEDLVIGGAFETTFAGEGVQFDRATGAFSVERTAGQSVIVHGQGVPHTWTRRALRRAGYAVATNSATPPVQITLSGSEHRPQWHLNRSGIETTHDSIRDLLAALNSAPAWDDETAQAQPMP